MQSCSQYLHRILKYLLFIHLNIFGKVWNSSKEKKVWNSCKTKKEVWNSSEKYLSITFFYKIYLLI